MGQLWTLHERLHDWNLERAEVESNFYQHGIEEQVLGEVEGVFDNLVHLTGHVSQYAGVASTLDEPEQQNDYLEGGTGGHGDRQDCHALQQTHDQQKYGVHSVVGQHVHDLHHHERKYHSTEENHAHGYWNHRIRVILFIHIRS